MSDVVGYADILREAGLPECCTVCGDDSHTALEWAYLYVLELKRAGKPLVSVCATCADLIANAFSMKHTGEALTPGHNGWPDRLQPEVKRGKLSGTTRTRIFERDQYQCVSCGIRKDLCVDHIHPVVLGGSDDDANLQTLCHACNASKGARTDWKGRKEPSA